MRLNWIQLKTLKREFELRSDEGMFGLLKWQRLFGSLASAFGRGEISKHDRYKPRDQGRTRRSSFIVEGRLDATMGAPMLRAKG